MNRNAATVYLSLLWLAGDKRQLNTTRQKIAAVCHLHQRRISEAMQALHDGGWVTVNYGRAGNKAWYRLSFPVGRFVPVCMKTAHREGSGSDKKSTQGAVPCVYENDPLSPIGDKARDPARLNAAGHAPAEHPADIAEREALALVSKA